MADISQLVITKAQTNPNSYMTGSMQIGEPLAHNGKPNPFNLQAAVKEARGWVYAAANINAIGASSVPLRLYARKQSGKKRLVSARKIDRRKRKYFCGEGPHQPSNYVMTKSQEWGEEFEEVTEHTQIMQLLQRPNPWMSGSEFCQLKWLFLQITGDYYQQPILQSASIGKGKANRIDQLWICPSQFMKIVPGNPKAGEWIKEYIYGVNTSVQQRFEPDEIQHMKLPNMEDMFYGMGRIQAGWPVITLSDLQMQEDIARKRNQSRPDLAVITESANGTLEQLKELQQEWARTFRGSFKAGSPVFLTGKTSIIPLNWAPTEIGDREITIEQIAAVFNVPVSLLKANDPNLASASVGFAFWMKMGILPLLRMDEEFLNNAIMPIYDLEGEAFLAYDDPVPENKEEVRKDVTTGANILTLNEKRVRMGEEPIDDPMADTVLVASGQTPLDMVGQPPMMGGFTMPGGDRDSNNSTGNDKRLGGRTDNQYRSQPEPGGSLREKRNGGNDDRDGDAAIGVIEQSDIIYAKHIHTKGDADDTAREGEKETPITKMTRDMNVVFESQRKACVGILTGKKDDRIRINEIMAELSKWDKAISDAIAPYMEQQLLNGGVQGYEQINLPPETWTVSNPRVAEFVRHYTVRLAGEINDYTAKLLSETLGDGLAAGESVGALAQRVNGVYDDFDGYRSEMIARTESARAYTSGQGEAWKESGIVRGKRWGLANAGCPVCSAIAKAFNDKVTPLDQAFYPLGSVIPLPDGGVFKVDYMPIQGPPGHPHCRCTLEAVM